MDAQIPPPREPSPEPTLPRNTDFALPCPHCIPGNPFGWTCVTYAPRSDPFHRNSFQLSKSHPRPGNESRSWVAAGGWRTSRPWVLWTLVSTLRFLGAAYPAQPIIARTLWLSWLPPHLVVTFAKSLFVESESLRGAAQLHFTPNT